MISQGVVAKGAKAILLSPRKTSLLECFETKDQIRFQDAVVVVALWPSFARCGHCGVVTPAVGAWFGATSDARC